MQHKNIFDAEFGFGRAILFASLIIFPNVLAVFHFSVFGIRLHFFQYLVFLAAIIYGPAAGMLSGGIGSLYTAIAMDNPYIIVGNIILGGFAGYLMKKGVNVMHAIMLAFAAQIPWLYATDVYLAGMPAAAASSIIIALFLSNIICSFLANSTAAKIKGIFYNA